MVRPLFTILSFIKKPLKGHKWQCLGCLFPPTLQCKSRLQIVLTKHSRFLEQLKMQRGHHGATSRRGGVPTPLHTKAIDFYASRIVFCADTHLELFESQNCTLNHPYWSSSDLHFLRDYTNNLCIPSFIFATAVMTWILVYIKVYISLY